MPRVGFRTSALCLALAAIVFACAAPGSSGSGTAPEPPPAGGSPRLSAGADLPADLSPSSEREAARRGSARPLDLGTDRAAVKIDLPQPPAGGSVAFETPDGRRAWVTRLPEGAQLPALAFGDGRIYASGGFSSTSFYALSASTGTIEWQTQSLEDNGPTAAIYEDGRIIFNTESCTLFVLDARTGRRKWFKWLGDPTLAQAALGENLIFAAYPTPQGHKLGAFRLHNGGVVWSRRITNELLAAPVVHGDSVYLSTLSGHTYRFLTSGKLVWRSRLDATTAPWIDGDRLYVSRRQNGQEKQIVVSVANGALLEEHHGVPGGHLTDVPRDLSSWPKVWEFEGSRPAIRDGVRYVAMAGELVASNALTGDAVWIRRDSQAGGMRSLGTVALAGPEVVLSSRAGTLFGLDIDTGYTIWSYDVGVSITAEPIVARGWVYVGTRDGQVIALEVADTSVDGWHMFGGGPGHNGPPPPTPVGPRQKAADLSAPSTMVLAERRPQQRVFSANPRPD